MAGNVLLKLFILFVLAGLHTAPKVCANNHTLAQSKLFYHLKQEPQWRDMWFTEYEHDGEWKPIMKIAFKNPKLLVLDRLRLVSPMMGCAYGVKLNWFLLLTLQTIAECNEMQKNRNALAGDCKVKLEEVLGRGKYVMLKLMRTLLFIDPGNHISMDNNRFYKVLCPLYDFVTALLPIEYSGILPGGLFVNQLLNGVAQSLKEILLATCYPPYREFDITTITREYNTEAYPNGIYPIYIDQLKTYIDYIHNHLIQLGIHYNEVSDIIMFHPTRIN